MSNSAIILAAGSGTRMKSDRNKMLLKVSGKTVIERTVETFCGVSDIDEVIVVCREDELDEFEKVLSEYDISYCFGGATRQQSVFNAIETIDDCDLVIIHDGARPLVTEDEIIKTLIKAQQCGAAAVGVPVKDTIKVVDDGNVIIDTPDRDSLVAIQTPQIFNFSLYRKAVEKALKEKKDFTDDCGLIEHYGEKVSVVIGSYTNIKITTPEDIILAESIINSRGEDE